MTGVDWTWLPWALIALPLVGAALVAAGRAPVVVGCLVTAGELAGACLAGWLVWQADDGAAQLVTDVSWVPALDLRFHVGVDGLSAPLLVLTALLGLLCCVYTLRYPPAGGRPGALIALVLLLEAGLVGSFLALDLLLFFLFFELVLVPMWFLIAWWGDPHDRAGRVRAATTFLVYTVAGSALMLLGFLLVRGQTGSFDIVALTAAAGVGMSGGVQLAAAGAITLGLAVKTPMWPLHTWLPDAHEKAPTIGSVLLAGVLLKLGTYGMLRIAVPVAPDGFAQLAPYLAAFAVVGIVYGSYACLAQTDLKRLVAYSSVGHMGFVLLGIASLTQVGLNGAAYANIAHGVITALLFFLAGAVKERNDTADMRALGGGMYGRVPRLAALLAFAAVASLGLPGLAGFWGEMLALAGAYQPDDALDRPFALVLMAVAGVGVALTAAYLLRMVRLVCQGEPPAGAAAQPDVTAVEVTAWAPLVALTVLLGVWPGLLLGLSGPAVALLTGGSG